MAVGSVQVTEKDAFLVEKVHASMCVCVCVCFLLLVTKPRVKLTITYNVSFGMTYSLCYLSFPPVSALILSSSLFFIDGDILFLVRFLWCLSPCLL